jgi:hypothetical protein
VKSFYVLLPTAKINLLFDEIETIMCANCNSVNAQEISVNLLKHVAMYCVPGIENCGSQTKWRCIGALFVSSLFYWSCRAGRFCGSEVKVVGVQPEEQG